MPYTNNAYTDLLRQQQIQQQTALGRQEQQMNALTLQEHQQKAAREKQIAAQLQNAGRRAPSLQDQGAALQGVQEPDVIGMRKQTLTQLQTAGEAVRESDPIMAMHFEEQASKIQEEVYDLEKKKATNQHAAFEHMREWIGGIDSQEKLDYARQLGGEGVAKLLPSTYTPMSKPIFEMLAARVADKAKQLDIERKTIELKYAERNAAAEAAKKQADASKARVDLALAREKLDAPAPEYSDAQDALLKADQKYEEDLRKARAKILSDKKISEKVVKNSMWDKLTTSDEELPPEISPRDKALALAEEEATHAHAKNKAAIRKRYAKVLGEPELSGDDQAALTWANENPADPRAKQIKERLGL